MTSRTAARRLLIIFNPAAGWRRRRRLAPVLAQLRAHGCAVVLRETERPGDAERFAAEADPAAWDLVVAAGGDGTVNEAINGLAHSGLPLALIPLGTANVLAAEIGLSTDPAAVARCVAFGQPRPIALGAANGRRFLLMAGAGFDARVVAGVSGPMKRWLGKGAYVLSALRELLVFDFPGYEVRTDNMVHHAASVIVANARHYAGRFVCAPEASLESDTLQVCLFERRGRLAAVGYSVALVTGRLPDLASYRVIEARRIEIRGRPGEPLQGDGDVIGQLDVAIEVLPGALDLIYPATTSDGSAPSASVPA
ncbi:MAG: diacylglycerol/lipid kinase family protein [Geminicoccaceae bacterium]